MATPNEKLADSLDALKSQQGSGRRVLKSGEIGRAHRGTCRSPVLHNRRFARRAAHAEITRFTPAPRCLCRYHRGRKGAALVAASTPKLTLQPAICAYPILPLRIFCSTNAEDRMGSNL